MRLLGVTPGDGYDPRTFVFASAWVLSSAGAAVRAAIRTPRQSGQQDQSADRSREAASGSTSLITRVAVHPTRLRYPTGVDRDDVPLQTFRSIEDMNNAPVIASGRSDFERRLRHRARFWKLAPRVYPRGVFKCWSVEDMRNHDR